MRREWIAARAVKLRAERDRLEHTLPDRSAERPRSPGEITALADALGGIVSTLDHASPENRAAVYRQLNVRLKLRPHGNARSERPWTSHVSAVVSEGGT